MLVLTVNLTTCFSCLLSLNGQMSRSDVKHCRGSQAGSVSLLCPWQSSCQSAEPKRAITHSCCCATYGTTWQQCFSPVPQPLEISQALILASRNSLTCMSYQELSQQCWQRRKAHSRFFTSSLCKSDYKSYTGLLQTTWKRPIEY